MPQTKEGWWQVNGASDPHKHSNLLLLDIPNSSYGSQATRMAGGKAVPAPAGPRSGAPPGPCFRPHVSGFSFLPVSTAPPQLLPTHMPLSTDILSSFLPPFLPLCPGVGGPLLPPWTSCLLPLLNTVPLEIHDQVLCSALPTPSARLWGRGEPRSSQGNYNSQCTCKPTVVHTGSCSP